MNSTAEYPYRGYRIKVMQDPDPQNPRTEHDNVTRMACFHGRHVLGDKDHCGFKSKDYMGWDEMKRAIEARDNPAVIMPLYLYDHSGLTISTTPFSCPWDSGQVGFCWIPETTVLQESLDRAKLDEVLTGEVKAYDAFLTGSIYGVIVLNGIGEEVYSCWGYGYDDVKSLEAYAIGEAIKIIDDLEAKK